MDYLSDKLVLVLVVYSIVLVSRSQVSHFRLFTRCDCAIDVTGSGRATRRIKSAVSFKGESHPARETASELLPRASLAGAESLSPPGRRVRSATTARSSAGAQRSHSARSVSSVSFWEDGNNLADIEADSDAEVFATDSCVEDESSGDELPDGSAASAARRRSARRRDPVADLLGRRSAALGFAPSPAAEAGGGASVQKVAQVIRSSVPSADYAGRGVHRDFIRRLPAHLGMYILSFLDKRSLLNAKLVCKYWRVMATEAYVERDVRNDLKQEVMLIRVRCQPHSIQSNL